MRLHALHLQNFRQHSDTRLTFDNGLTGIIGPNGAGKSTLLEAIAWALYGNTAARGTRDSIRNARADARASVKVELDFELSGHRYRVVRGITTAECYLDGGDTPIASSTSAVTQLLRRRLRMTHSEFFHTYFTAQKELDIMAALGPVDRARFLSRVLGYDRLTDAQELARERRRALVAEITGLKQGMPDAAAITQLVADAEVRLTAAKRRAKDAESIRTTTAARLAMVEPKWTAAQAERERVQRVLNDVRLAESESLALMRDLERIDRDLDAIANAQNVLKPLLEELAPLTDVRASLIVQEGLAAAESRRQAFLERERGSVEEDVRLDERASKLESAPALEVETSQQLAAVRSAVATLEQSLEQERTSWVRDRQEAETRLENLQRQSAELVQQRETLEGLGEKSPCPTCGRPLGASYRSVLDLLSEQIETVRIDVSYYRQRVEQLVKTPDAIDVLEEQRRGAQQEVSSSERRLHRIHLAMVERKAISEQRSALALRLEETRQTLAALPTGYDAGQHRELRETLTRLADVETQAARLGGMVEKADVTRAERQRVDGALAELRQRKVTLDAQRGTDGLTDSEYAALRESHEAATLDARRAELESVAATADGARAQSEMEEAKRRQRDLRALQHKLDLLEGDKRVHDELDRALTDLRTDLNFQLRPELSEIASGFLADLTDGRYTAVEFDEDYTLVVLEDGLPKPVISGGEEDLCNLVLRLAISQMIAERAGQAFSLLILDEVFGSLDDARRANVIAMLRRLNDRFEQVIVITHIEQVREGLDRVLVVRFDEERGTSVVTAGADAMLEVE
ncbi:MAG: SMC family ATPase [Gemmatimonas sp.]